MSSGLRRGRAGAGHGDAERQNMINPAMSNYSVSDLVSQLPHAKVSLSREVEDRIKSLLGEIAQNRFEGNALQVVAYTSALVGEKDGRLLGLVLDLIFWNVRDKPELSNAFIFARLATVIAQDILPTVQDQHTRDVNGRPVMGAHLVYMYLTARCLETIEQVWGDKIAAMSSAYLSSARELDRSRAIATAGRANITWTVLVRFIHALYQGSLIQEGPVHQCIEKMLSLAEHTHTEVSTLQKILFESQGSKAYRERDRMDWYYARIMELTRTEASPQARAAFRAAIDNWINPPDWEQICMLRTPTQQQPAYPPASSQEGSTSKITPTTPLHDVIGMLGSLSKIDDYTYELSKAINCSSTAVTQGGASDIYRATLRGGARVAVKCIRTSVTGDHNVVKRTARELDAWSKLRHENILELLGMAVFQNKLAMISLWMERGSIVDVVNKLPLDMDRFKLSMQVASAVAFMHEKKVVHGDLKGANVLVMNDGTPKVTDFGLSMMYEGVFQHSMSNMSGGTMRWMAPELLSNESKHTIRNYQTDIYALGMTMLEIFTGKEPFHEVFESHLIPYVVCTEKKIPGRPEYLSNRSKQNNMFWNVLKSCWMYEPEKRATAVEVETLARSGAAGS